MRAHNRVSSVSAKPSSNPNNIYILRDRHVVNQLVTSADPSPGDLVVEFGAGTGVLTERLAQTGARALAIEKNPRLISRLERRFGDVGSVRVIAADARTVMLPRRPFVVVANLPYSISTAVIRRLLSPYETSMGRADLLVQWGFALGMTQTTPRKFETAWWQARFDLTIANRVRPRAFNPAPSVDSAHLVIRRRPMSRRKERQVWDDLRAAYGVSARAARRVTGPR